LFIYCPHEKWTYVSLIFGYQVLLDQNKRSKRVIQGEIEKKKNNNNNKNNVTKRDRESSFQSQFLGFSLAFSSILTASTKPLSFPMSVALLPTDLILRFAPFFSKILITPN